jgi:hypothetical protein
MSAEQKSCAEFSEWIVFYAWNELETGEKLELEAHLAVCEGCRTQLVEERRLTEAIGSMATPAEELDPAGVLLSQCRSDLAEKLDDATDSHLRDRVKLFGWLRNMMAMRPVWSAAALLLFGLLVGTQSTQWFARQTPGNGLAHAVNVRPGPQITDEQLSKMSVAGINFTGGSTQGQPTVKVKLSAEQPVELTGNLDDKDVRRVLTYVVENGDRFDSGVRLDCLDALRERTQDETVRRALLAAARKDQNPAVRLKALESLRDSASDAMVREALLEALQRDPNPGVRVEAVNMLVRSLESAELSGVEVPRELGGPAGVQVVVPGGERDASMMQVVHTLDELRRKDPNKYVRLRSAAALRQIGPSEEQ